RNKARLAKVLRRFIVHKRNTMLFYDGCIEAGVSIDICVGLPHLARERRSSYMINKTANDRSSEEAGDVLFSRLAISIIALVWNVKGGMAAWKGQLEK
ncbi:MAG: hypothetical protein Q7O66_22550, partial [Dehalococcoidia bacterium]|nr:hypothetical protein [Dehalococcoidia bacterium]